MFSFFLDNFSITFAILLCCLPLVVFMQYERCSFKLNMGSIRFSDILLVVFWLVSGFGFIFTTDFVFLFIFLVAFNICLYALMLSSKTRAAAEATSKYLAFSSLSVCSLLFGFFAYYCEYGTLNIPTISVILAESSVYAQTMTFWEIIGASFVIFAICIKLGAFPGFLWSADVYDGVSTPVLSLLLVSKVFIFALLVKLFNVFGASHIQVWGPILCLAGCGSLYVGTFGAIMQQRLKRFLAYSSINHIGFGLIALSTEVGVSFSSFSYVLVYVLTSLILVYVFSSVYTVSGNRSFTYISDLSTLMLKDKLLGWIVIFTMFSLAGIPPFLGFFTKYSVLLTCASSTEYWGFIAFFVAIFLLPFATFNYLRVIKNMLFRGYYSSEFSSKFFINMPYNGKDILVSALLALILLPTWGVYLVNFMAGIVGING